MRSLTYLLGLFSVISSTVGAVPSPALTILERLPSIPQGWRQGDAIPASKLLKFRIALKQQNAFEFEQHVLDISTPDHPKYGQHMSRGELKRMLRPSSDATKSIMGWLEAQGVSAASIEDDGDWINFHVLTVEAERILNTKLASKAERSIWEERITDQHHYLQILLLHKLGQWS
ncbi:polynucleotide 3'-phosphatase [Lignoscripta atroalba]|nr:polynucleotide 3'-phosphatase [Lignoscripta atroalba]